MRFCNYEVATMETRPREIPELTNIYLFEEFPRLLKRNF